MCISLTLIYVRRWHTKWRKKQIDCTRKKREENERGKNNRQSLCVWWLVAIVFVARFISILLTFVLTAHLASHCLLCETSDQTHTRTVAHPTINMYLNVGQTPINFALILFIIPLMSWPLVASEFHSRSHLVCLKSKIFGANTWTRKIPESQLMNYKWLNDELSGTLNIRHRLSGLFFTLKSNRVVRTKWNLKWNQK